MTKTDPVCGAAVDPVRARAMTILGAVRYYFCSVEHRDAFTRNPASFLGGAPSPVAAPAARPPTASAPTAWATLLPAGMSAPVPRIAVLPTALPASAVPVLVIDDESDTAPIALVEPWTGGDAADAVPDELAQPSRWPPPTESSDETDAFPGIASWSGDAWLQPTRLRVALAVVALAALVGGGAATSARGPLVFLGLLAGVASVVLRPRRPPLA
ncbi:MAG: hypothetical protein EXR73_10235 [Myxococcales bacterium]|nr:hypothetical protein [Myxococcales bacterium]